MVVGIKEVDKPLRFVQTVIKYRSDCCKSFIGNTADGDRCDFVGLNKDGLFLAVDEEGLLKSLPINFFLEMDNPRHPIQKMVGTGVFVRIKPVNIFEEEIWDYEVIDLTQRDMVFISTLLSDKYQAELKANFKDYQLGDMVDIKSFDNEDDFFEFLQKLRG